MARQFFTFGCGHTFGGSSYVTVVAETDSRCRELMFHTFGERWSMQYGEDQLESLHEASMGCIATIIEDDLGIRTEMHQATIVNRAGV